MNGALMSMRTKCAFTDRGGDRDSLLKLNDLQASPVDKLKFNFLQKSPSDKEEIVGVERHVNLRVISLLHFTFQFLHFAV
jgi:hypothetical protein